MSKSDQTPPSSVNEKVDEYIKYLKHFNEQTAIMVKRALTIGALFMLGLLGLFGVGTYSELNDTLMVAFEPSVAILKQDAKGMATAVREAAETMEAEPLDIKESAVADMKRMIENEFPEEVRRDHMMTILFDLYDGDFKSLQARLNHDTAYNRIQLMRSFAKIADKKEGDVRDVIWSVKRYYEKAIDNLKDNVRNYSYAPSYFELGRLHHYYFDAHSSLSSFADKKTKWKSAREYYEKALQYYDADTPSRFKAEARYFLIQTCLLLATSDELKDAERSKMWDEALTVAEDLLQLLKDVERKTRMPSDKW